MGKTLNPPRKGQRPRSRRSSPLTPAHPFPSLEDTHAQTAQSPATGFRSLDTESAVGASSVQFAHLQPSPSPSASRLEQRIALDVTVNVVKVMVAVTVPTREMELTIQRLQGELRHTRLENESIKCSLNRTIEGLRVELMRGRHMLSHLRRKLVMGDSDNKDTSDDSGESDDSGSSNEEDEHRENEEHREHEVEEAEREHEEHQEEGIP